MAEKVVGQLVVTVDANTELAEARLKGLQASLKSLDYLDKDLSDITIGGNFLDEALKRVTGGFMQLIQGLSASAFRGAAGVFTSIASAGYDTAKSIETAHVAFETFLGSGEEADKLLKKIRKDAMITPFDVSGLSQATQKLLMVEKNGLAAEQTIMNLGKALTAAGKGDEQLANLTNYLQQIGINAKVTQRQISAFGTAGVDIIGMVSERQGIAIEKTKEWLQSISNPYDVIADAINAAGEAGGRFADVYNLMGGTIEQLTANMHDAIGTFGEAAMKLTGLDEQIKGVLRSLSNFFNVFEHPENVATVAASIKKLFGEINAGSVVTNVLNGITKALAAFNSGQFDNMIIFFKQFFGVLKQFAGVSLIGRSIKMILDLFSDNHTAAEVRKIATQLATLLKVIWEFRLIGKITSVFTSFARIAVQAFTSVGSAAFALLGIIASVFGVFSSGGDIFGGLFKGVSDVVADAGAKTANEANKSGKNIVQNIGDGATSAAEGTKSKLQDIYEELAKLQAQWVKEMGDMGAFDLKEQLAWYQKFQAEYAVGTKARISMDEKVHDAELAISKDIISKVDEFNEVFNKAMKTAKEYYDMFEYTQATLRRTTESVIEGLRRQNDNMLKYYQNLKKMSEMGFDTDFMQYVYDAGMDAASEVAGLADATQEQVDEINEMWKTRGQIATDIAVLNTQRLKNETLAEVADLQSSLSTQVVDVYDSGTLLMRSFTEGIMDYMPTLEDAMANVAATASGAGGGGGGGIGDVGDFDWDWEDLMNYDDYEGLLDRMNIDAFEYGDAMGLLGEILKQNWALMLPGLISFMSIIKKEIFGVKKNAVDSIDETTKEVKNGVNSAKGSMSSLINEIQKVYNCMWQIQNYKSVYDTAMNGVLGSTDQATKQMVQLIDFVKGNYSSLPTEMKINTAEATEAISDITVNGMDNIGAETQATIEKVRQACEYMKRDTAESMTESTDIVAGEVAKSIEHTEKAAVEAGKEVQKLAEGAEKHLLEAGDSVARIAEKSSAEVEKAVEKTVQKTKKKVAEGQTDMFAAFDKMEAEAKNTVVEVSNSANDVSQIVADTAEKEMRRVDSSLSTSTDSALDKFYRIGNGAESGIRTAGNAFSSLGSMLDGVAPELADSMNGIGATLGSAAEIASNNVVTKFTSKLRGAADLFGQMKSKVDTLFTKNIANPITDGIENLAKKTTVDAAKAAKPIGEIPKTAADGVNKNSNIITRAVSKVTDTITEIINSFVNIFFNIANNLLDGVMKLAKTIFGGLGKALAALIQPLSNPSLLIGTGVLIGIATAILEVAAAIKIVAEAIKIFIEDLMLMADAFVYVSNTAMNVNYEGLGRFGLAVAELGAIFAATSYLNIIGAISGMFAAGMASQMVVIAKGLSEAAKYSQQIDINALSNIAWAVNAIGGVLTVGLVSNVLGAISGLAGMMVAGELLVIAAGLAEAAKYSQQIDVGAIAHIGWAVDAIGGILTIGLVTNIAGAISGLAAMLMSGELLVAAKGLAEASKYANQIDIAGLASIAGAIDAVGAILAAGAPGNILGAISGLFSMGVAAEVASMAKSLESTMGSLQSMLHKMQELGREYGGNKQAIMQDIGEILYLVGCISSAFSGSLIATIVAANKKMQTDSIREMSSNIDTTLGTIQSMCNKMKELVDQGYSVNDIKERVYNVELIVQTLASINFEQSKKTLAEVAKKTAELTKLASDYENIVGNIESIMWKMIEMDKEGYDVTKAVALVENVKTIVGEIAKIDFSQKKSQLEEVAKKAESLEAANKSYEAIIGDLESIMWKMKEMLDAGYTPEAAVTLVTQVRDIVWKLAEINFSQSKQTITDTAEKAAELATFASNLDSCIDNVTKMIDSIKAFTEAYAGTTVAEQVQKVNDEILRPLLGDEEHAGIYIPEAVLAEDDVKQLEYASGIVDKVAEISGKLKKVEDVSKEILNADTVITFISESLGKLPSAIANYTADMQDQGFNMAKAFIDGWESMHATGAEAAHSMQNKMWSAIEARMRDEFEQGKTLAKNVVNGFNEVAKSQAYEAGHSFQSAVWRGIQDRMGDMKSQGDAIADNEVSGLVNGINNRLPQIASGVRALGQTAIDKLKDILDIHSPSRVMAEIGGQVSTGFAEGILDGLGTVSDAGESLAEAVMGGYDSAIEPLSTSAMEARAWTDYEKGNAGAVAGGGHTANIVQNNNIYSQLDMDTAMNDLAWAVARS